MTLVDTVTYQNPSQCFYIYFFREAILVLGVQAERHTQHLKKLSIFSKGSKKMCLFCKSVWPFFVVLVKIFNNVGKSVNNLSLLGPIKDRRLV